MLKKLCLTIIIVSNLLLLSGCLFSGIKLNKIKYVFYTVGFSDYSLKYVQGKELTQWVDNSLDVQPNEFEIVVALNNSGFQKIQSTKVRVEFWLAESKPIDLDNGNATDIEEMRKRVKWAKFWEEDLVIKDLSSNESREIKVKRVQIAKLCREEIAQKKLVVMGWNFKIKCGSSEIEKPFQIEFLD